MADFLHGVETINKGNAPKNVSEVKTSVIGIVGRAASSGWKDEAPAVNTPIVIMKAEDVEGKLGTSDEEGTLPYYLKKMYEQFDKQVPLIIAVNVGTGGGSSEPEDTNIYLVDHEGNVITDGEGNPIVIGDTIADATDEVSGGSEIGDTITDAMDEVSGIAGNAVRKTGVYALLKSQIITGYVPRIIVAPGYSQNLEVAQAMVSVCETLRARGFVDIDSSLENDVSLALATRGNPEKVGNIYDKRISLFWPKLKSGDKLYPMSAIAAAVRAKTDMDSSMGYHWSISSQKINGFTGLDIPVTYSLNISSADSQKLNSRGIVTVKNVGGLKFCGNTNSSFDSESSGGNTDHEIFEVTMTTGDVIEESIEYYTEQKIDQPINNVWIDSIVSDVNAFLRKLAARGAIAGGRCWYDPDENEPTEIMAGHIIFDYDDAATPPADRVTYQRSYNVDYLAQLGR